MRKIIVVSKDKVHEFEADTAYFNISPENTFVSLTLEIIKNNEIIAEFAVWEYWRYVD